MATTIDRATLADWIERSAPFDLVDTLPARPYARHHLPGAIHIVSDDIETEAPRRLPDRERTVVVYCGSTACQCSSKAAARLHRLGYRDVREYAEGRQDWQAAGLPLETGRTRTRRRESGGAAAHCPGTVRRRLIPRSPREDEVERRRNRD